MLALMEKKEELVKTLKGIVAEAEKDGGVLSAEARERFDRIVDEVKEINATLERQMRLQWLESCNPTIRG